MVVEIQQIENRIFWCGFGFHEDFCIGTVPLLIQFLNLSVTRDCFDRDFAEIAQSRGVQSHWKQ